MIETRLLMLVMIGAVAASAASAQPARVSQAPVGANENVPRASFLSQMDLEFGKMDGDKNGKVTRAEIEIFERGTALAQARARAQARFAELDTDRNGQISPAEFAKLVPAVPAVDGRPLLGRLDSNKDGALSLVEHRAGKLAYFDQIDSDKDGVVTVAEMKAAGVIK